MFNSKPIQLMPIDSGHINNDCMFIGADDDADRNVQWSLAGAALLEDGRIVPVLWDGYLTFKPFDPEKLRLVKVIDKAIAHAHGVGVMRTLEADDDRPPFK